MRKVLIVVAVLAACSMAMAEDIYKWVDSDGNVHYSNTPPPKANVKKVNVEDPAPPTGGGTPTPSAEYWRQKDEEFRKRQEEKFKVEQEPSDRAALDRDDKRKKTCEFYRKDLEQVLGTRERVARSTDGDDIVVDPHSAPLNVRQRAHLIGELNASIAQHCK